MELFGHTRYSIVLWLCFWFLRIFILFHESFDPINNILTLSRQIKSRQNEFKAFIICWNQLALQLKTIQIKIPIRNYLNNFMNCDLSINFNNHIGSYARKKRHLSYNV